MRFFGILLGVLLFPFNAFSGDISKFNFSGETPAAFFSSGISGYYVTDDGIKILRYRETEKNDEININDNVANSENEFGMAFNENGSVMLIRKNNNYSCPLNVYSNCVLSNPIIEKIDVKNLTGKVNTENIGSKLEKHRNGFLNFTLGSKLYTLTVRVPNYNFNSFKDFDSLKCIRDTVGKCINFADEGAHYEQALMGFSKARIGQELAFVKNINDSAPLTFNEKEMTIQELHGDCAITTYDKTEDYLEISETDEKTDSCKMETETVAKIAKKFHPNGMAYFIIDYEDNNIKDEIYFTDNSGYGYKIFLNNEELFSINLFNKTAAEIVFNAL